MFEGKSVEGSRIVRAGELTAEARAIKLLIEAQAARERATVDLAGQLQTLVVEVAKRVIGDELAERPARVAHVVSEAIKKVKRARELVVVLNPADVGIVRAEAESIGARGGRPLPFEVEEDEALARGDCVVRSNLGDIDARIETQLLAFEAALRAASRT